MSELRELFETMGGLDLMAFAVGEQMDTTIELRRDGTVAVYCGNYPFEEPTFFVAKQDSQVLRVVADWLDTLGEKEQSEGGQDAEPGADRNNSIEAENEAEISLVMCDEAKQQQLLA